MNDPNDTHAYLTRRDRRGDARRRPGAGRERARAAEVTGTISVAFGNLGAAVDIELLFPRNVRAWIDTPNVSIGPLTRSTPPRDATTFTAAHGLKTGDAVVYRAQGGSVGGLANDRRTSSAGSTRTLRLHTSLADALAGSGRWT